MIKIDAKKIRWWYWPFKEETFLKWQKTVSILLRIKIVIIVLFVIAAYLYFGKNMVLEALAITIGGVLAIIVGIVYYYLIKTGKIQYKK